MDLIQKVGNHEEYQSGRGIFLDMFIELQKCLNFTFSLKLSPDGKYGSMTKNASWNGIIHYLWNGDFDIGTLLLERVAGIGYHKTAASNIFGRSLIRLLNKGGY